MLKFKEIKIFFNSLVFRLNYYLQKYSSCRIVFEYKRLKFRKIENKNPKSKYWWNIARTILATLLIASNN